MAFATNPSAVVFRYWPAGVLALVIAAFAIACLIATDFHPTYTLDDAWIHLQFSEQIVGGHFGLVPEERASPSSSILYPLLLTPLANTSLHQWQPALWNLAALFGALLLWQRLLQRFVLHDLSPERREWLAGLLALVAVVCTNMLWLASTGMEHTLQIVATLAVIVGLLELFHDNRGRGFLLAGLILGPLLRLENFSITLPVVVMLLWYRHWPLALAALIGSIGGVVVHGLISQAEGLPFLGGPILLKGWVDHFSTGRLEGLGTVLQALANTVRSGRPDDGILLLGALLAIAGVRWLRRGDKLVAWLCVVAIGSLAAQITVGGLSRLSRHEIYSECFGFAVVAYAAAPLLLRTLQNLGSTLTVLAAASLMFGFFPANLVWTLGTPLAAQDIWRQHWQMRRLLIEHYKGPVAVNDVGLTAYRNPHFVLDLVGLGSEDVRNAQSAGRTNAAFFASLIEKHRIEAALIYDGWFARVMPEHFQKVAEFRLNRQQVAAAYSIVVVYAANPQAAARLRQAVDAVAPTMPQGSTLVWLP